MNWLERLLFNSILSRLDSLEERIMGLQEELDTLTANVAANGDVIQSAVVLIQGIAAQLAALAADPVKVRELAAKLKTNTDALAAAVAANTPAEEPPA